MEPNQFYGDFASQFSDAPAVGATGVVDPAGGADANKGAEGAGVIKALPWGERLFKAIPDTTKRAEFENIVRNVALNVAKIGTPDLQSMFVSSISSRMPEIRETRTHVLNVCESIPGPTLMTADWVYRMIMRQQGYDKAPAVNPEAAIGATQEGVYEEQYNTLQFWGFPLYESFVARAQAQQQTNLSPFAKETDNGLRSIRRAVNYDFINGVRQAVFTGSNIPKLGGILDGIKTNTISAGSADFTDTNLNTGYNTILDALGNSAVENVYLFTNKKEVGVVRTMEITRYGGQNSVAYATWQQEKAAEAAAFGVKPNRFWEPAVGGVVPVFYEIDLPNSGTHQALMMSVDPQYGPRPVYFSMEGEIGPWMFVLPQPNYLRRGVMLLHGATLDAPAEVSRVKYTNLPVG